MARGRRLRGWTRRVRETDWGVALADSPVRIFLMLIAVAVVVEAVQEALRTLLPALPGVVEVAVGALWLPLLLAIPLWRVVLRPLLVQHARLVDEMEMREAVLERDAARLDFDTSLRSALEMAETEDEVVEVARLALARGDAPTHEELMLAPDPDAALQRRAVREAPDGLVDCDVRGVRGCPAVRRGTVMTFDDSEDLASCPRLRGRNDRSVRATCAPVVVLGTPVGVVHAVAARDDVDLPDPDRVTSVAQRVGTRLSLVRLLAEVTERAETDPLTGLANRRRLADRYDAVAEDPGPHALAMCDLDHFKALNDAHGHDVGDEALRTFAAVLREATRPGDLAVRFGGEEFAVLLPACSTAQALEVLDRVRQHLAEVLARRVDLPDFTVSIGVADTSTAPADLAGLLHAADEALYEAKRSGRDQVVAAA